MTDTTAAVHRARMAVAFIKIEFSRREGRMETGMVGIAWTFVTDLSGRKGAAADHMVCASRATVMAPITAPSAGLIMGIET